MEAEGQSHLGEIADVALCLNQRIVGVHVGPEGMLAHLLKLHHLRVDFRGMANQHSDCASGRGTLGVVKVSPHKASTSATCKMARVWSAHQLISERRLPSVCTPANE